MLPPILKALNLVGRLLHMCGGSGGSGDAVELPPVTILEAQISERAVCERGELQKGCAQSASYSVSRKSL